MLRIASIRWLHMTTKSLSGIWRTLNINVY